MEQYRLNSFFNVKVKIRFIKKVAQAVKTGFLFLRILFLFKAGGFA
jgi:hypothetical protein